MSSWRNRLALLALATAACSSSNDAETAPDYRGVFETRPAPTPNKLRGVWSRTTTADTGTTEIHLEFTDGFILGGARCLPPDKSRSVTTGGAAKLETQALDQAKGSFKMAGLVFQLRDDDISCGLTLAGNTYDFTISGQKLALTTANTGGASTFDKIGD